MKDDSRIQERRRIQKNKLQLELKDAENFISRTREAIGRIRSSLFNEEYIETQVEKLQKNIEDKELFIVSIHSNLEKLHSGELDIEIDQEYVKNKQTEKDTKEEKAKRKDIKDKEKEKNKDVSKKYQDKIIADSRLHRQTEKDMNYSFRYMNKVHETLPSFIKRNLSEMSGNKGYIWRGVCYYGDLKENKYEPRVMFEKKGGDLLVIHEYTDKEYKIFEKHGKDKKIQIHQEMRKNKSNKISLMDYTKK
jgi:hypothetical protein